MPFSDTPRVFPPIGPSDAEEAGSISLQLAAMADFFDGEAFSGQLAASAGQVIGSCYDAHDERVAPLGTVRRPDGVLPREVATAPLYLGMSTLNVINGRLTPAALTASS